MLSLISHNARRNLFWLVTICVNLVFTACSNDDNPSSDSSGGKEYTGIPLIILDTDIGSFTIPALPAAAKRTPIFDEKDFSIRFYSKVILMIVLPFSCEEAG